MTTINAALLAAALLFLLFIVAQALLPALIRRRHPEAHAKTEGALQRAQDASRPASERAAALRDAAEIALSDLHRPRLAVRHALEADRVLPGDAATLALLARAMMRAKRHRALERHLWNTMASHPDTAAHRAALDALIALYEGPLRTPERAEVLRSLSRHETTAPAKR